MRHPFPLIGLALFAACSGEAPASSDIQTLTLRAVDGRTDELTVELAQTPDEKARGLSKRQSLDGIDGMLFVLAEGDPSAVWMKDTWIPLDVAFLDEDGAVLRVYEALEPGDETIVDCACSAAFMLEVAGGRSAGLGLAPGASLNIAGLPSRLTE